MPVTHIRGNIIKYQINDVIKLITVYNPLALTYLYNRTDNFLSKS